MGKHISKDDQIRLIQECRNSGLSDYQWCSLNGISHSTFYRWVTKLRTETCTPVPSKVIPVSEKQKVVKLEIMEELSVTKIRKSIDGLCAIIQDKLMMDTSSNCLFLFCGRRRDRIKALMHEPDGYVLLYKRLTETGAYRWPRNKSEVRIRMVNAGS